MIKAALVLYNEVIRMSVKDRNKNKSTQIKEEIILTDPVAVSVVFHEKKSRILKLLVKKEMTIIDLKHATGMNTGTIKRHLDDLLRCNLIYISKEQLSEYSIVMKYYRAVAKKFNFNITWSGI